MSESVNNKYKLFNIDVLKEPLLRLSSIFLENLQKKGSLPLWKVLFEMVMMNRDNKSGSWNDKLDLQV